MPANLPPHYYKLEREFKAERDLNEKLRMAQELLALMPKHKGTDKLQAEMKGKISKLKKQMESGGSKSGGASVTAAIDHIDKEGAGQVILIGPPNSGKSSILDYFSNAKPLIADYPYTTREPLAGMMKFETIQLQLVDMPPISPDFFETWMLGIIRNSDLICMVAGLGDDGFEEQVQYVFDKLKERRIILTHTPPDPDDVEDLSLAYKKTIIAAHKIYDDEGEVRKSRFEELYPGFTVVGTSILDDETMDRLRATMFDKLNIMRVYTKTIGHDPDFSDPIIVPPGATVEEAAFALHKDFAYKLQYAKVWGEGKHDGQRVQKTFVLQDGDIIEFHL
ncbi:MAG: TGS domain-containing protein [candidate division Zixibacteria bacterium]|nr:TGS domain-containing protein [candidate division Zixibacteria bacterium]